MFYEESNSTSGTSWTIIFDWKDETSEVFVVRTAANLLAILLLAANLLANIC